MRLPREINRAVRESPEPKFLGEEGLLTPITLDTQRYYAKQWRGRHPDNPNRFGFFYGKEVDRSGVSPFWTKVKFYEYSLMHELFPDRIPKIAAGYDPRVAKDGDGFDVRGPRPVTMTEEIAGDPEAKRVRDAIVNLAYGNQEDIEVLDGDGKIVEHKDLYENMLAAGEVDRQMRLAFGKDLGIRDFISARTLLTKEGRDRFVVQVQRQYPNTRVAELVESGIVPVHAEFNFIPLGPSDERGANGVFVEAIIFDVKRFAAALARKRQKEMPGADSSEIMRDVARKIERYQLYRKLDETYDDLLNNLLLPRRDGLRSEVSKRAAVDAYRALGAVRQKYDQNGLLPSDDFFAELTYRLTDLTVERDASRRSEAVRNLERWIDAWPESPELPVSMGKTDLISP